MSLAASTDVMPFLFVTTGTERFPFSRIVTWIDEWLRPGPRAVRCLIQHGTAPPSALADSEAYLPFDRFVRTLETADVVVSHAGTGSIMLCRRYGRIPIVVPRLRSLGEHVDDHQVAFARLMAQQCEIVLAESRNELFVALDRALADPSFLRGMPRPGEMTDAILRFGALVDPLLNEGHRGR